MRDLGADEMRRLEPRPSPGRRDRLRLPEGMLAATDRAVRNPLSGEQSVLRTTLLGCLLDAARLQPGGGAERVACSSRAACTCARAPPEGTRGARVRMKRPPPA